MSIQQKEKPASGAGYSSRKPTRLRDNESIKSKKRKSKPPMTWLQKVDVYLATHSPRGDYAIPLPEDVT